MGGDIGGEIGAHVYPVHPRERHRLARAQEKYYRRCYEIENKRHRDLERIQNRREQLLGMLNGEYVLAVRLTEANQARYVRRGIL